MSKLLEELNNLTNFDVNMIDELYDKLTKDEKNELFGIRPVKKIESFDVNMIDELYDKLTKDEKNELFGIRPIKKTVIIDEE